MNNLEDAAVFILSIPPLDEITNSYTDVVERFRYNMISKEEAVDELITCYQKELTKFVENNNRINEECMYCAS